MSVVRPESVAQLAALRVLEPLDVHFAGTLARLAEERDALALICTAMVSRQARMGHVCLDLSSLAGAQLSLDLEDRVVELTWPDLSLLRRALQASPLVGDPGAATPLLLEGDRLYLRRYFDDERELVAALERRLASRRPTLAEAQLEAGLGRLFGSAAPEPAQARKSVNPDQLSLFADRLVAREAEGERPPEVLQEADAGQRDAARRAVERRFCVITGGPGTGKTSTVAKILVLLVEQARALGQAAPRIRLAAPTGKAAARLSEAIEATVPGLPCDPDVAAAIRGLEAGTIHRMLGRLRAGRGFLRNRASPLAVDAVIVDEASMVDLSLMARLLDAVPDEARLVLLGDKNQLASVEAGAVLGDICGTGLQPRARARSRSAVADAVVQLSRSYRYAKGSGIARLAAAIVAGDEDAVIALLGDERLADIAWHDAVDLRAGLSPALEREVRDGFAPSLKASGAHDRLHELGRFRVLCAHRHGPEGLIALNVEIEAALRREGWITGAPERYRGRPILVTQNDYRSGLFNGDVGVLECGTDGDSHESLLSYFRGPGEQLRRISTQRLPPHETVFAMSVHKSQGSEFDRVAIVLPREPSPVLSRELLYTAVTRARTGLAIFGRPEIIRHCVHTAVRRASGLRDRLWAD